MAAEMLLINSRKRRASKKAKRRSKRKSNPVSYRAVTRRAKSAAPASNTRRRKRRARRRNPVTARRRMSNPVSARGILESIVPMVRDAAIGAGGAIAVDAFMGQVNKYLPATMQPTPGAVGTNDAVKVVATIALGQLLSRPTRGLSRRAAAGALTVQMDKIIRTFLPPTVKAQLAYGTVAPVVPGRFTVQPNAQRGVAAYSAPGAPTPLLNGTGAYVRAGAASPLLNGRSMGNSRAGAAVR